MDLSVATPDPFPFIRERNFFQAQIRSRGHYPPFHLKPFIGFPLLWRRKCTPWQGLARSGLCPHLHTHLLLPLTPGFEPLWSSSSPGIVLSVTTLAWNTPLSLLCFPRPTGLFLLLQVSESMSPSPGWLSYLSCPLGCLSTVVYDLLLSLYSSRLAAGVIIVRYLPSSRASWETVHPASCTWWTLSKYLPIAWRRFNRFPQVH